VHPLPNKPIAATLGTVIILGLNAIMLSQTSGAAVPGLLAAG
jgi:hypothetical protein